MILRFSRFATHPLLMLAAGLSALSAVNASGQGVPGDGAPLNSVHPGYDLVPILPAGLAPGVSGMDFLSDGRLVISTWNGNHDEKMLPVRRGEVFILSNVDKDDVTKITYRKLTSQLQEPLGLKVVDDTIYVSERMAVAAVVDKNGDGTVDSTELRKVASYAEGGKRHEYFFGLAYKAGYFYGAHSLSLVNGESVIPQPNSNRGTFVKVDKKTGKTEYIAGGARTPFGIAFGPDGDLFATEVQGCWNPANKLNHVRPGRFYGHPQRQRPNKWDSLPFTPPAVYLPQTEIANAPGQPVLVENGVFAGQMLYGDVTYGGIQRVFLEKVAGEWQGAVFQFTGGLYAGVGRLLFDKQGSLYIGEVGHSSGNWHGPSGKINGLQKLKPNGKGAFEMLSMKSRAQGMEVEFTQPVEAGFADTAKYQVSSWYYVPDSTYHGSGPKEKKFHSIKSIRSDSSRKKVFLEIEGLKAGRIVHIRLRGLKSSAGSEAWSKRSWYTLNALGTSPPFTVSLRAERAKLASTLAHLSLSGGKLALELPADKRFDLRILDARGGQIAQWLRQKGRVSLPVDGLPRGMYFLEARGAGVNLHRALPIY